MLIHAFNFISQLANFFHWGIHGSSKSILLFFFYFDVFSFLCLKPIFFCTVNGEIDWVTPPACFEVIGFRIGWSFTWLKYTMKHVYCYCITCIIAKTMICKFLFALWQPDSIRVMGDKSTARETMKKANVPTVPGSDGLLQVPCLATICLIWFQKLAWKLLHCLQVLWFFIWLAPFFLI
jgi:hypothetical protein